ncbi:MAG TPA: hypothetical protein VMS08_01600 [Candidatus Saccharimonadia bacterium]|nr:hypothetical protein [Candidatus Saccharimonadia bacterium]
MAAHRLIRTAQRPVWVGFMGGPGQGKSTLGGLIAAAAGLTPAECMRETSDRIFTLTLLLRDWLQKQGRSRDLTDPRAVTLALEQVPVWFERAGCNLFEIPASVFNPERASLNAEDIRLLTKVMASFQRNPARFAGDITVETKDVFRPMMTALQGIVSHQALPHLQAHGYPLARNFWPVVAFEELDQLRRKRPGLPLLICSGLRLPGDDDELRRRFGFLLERLRFVPEESREALLRTEVIQLCADYVITGNCTLEELTEFARWLWLRLCGEKPFPSGLRDKVGRSTKTPLMIEEILAAA